MPLPICLVVHNDLPAAFSAPRPGAYLKPRRRFAESSGAVAHSRHDGPAHFSPIPPMSDSPSSGPRLIGRRNFLQWTAAGLATSGLAKAWGALEGAAPNAVKLPPLHDTNVEAKESTPDPLLPPQERVGFAVVGLGHLALGQVLPAFGSSKYARLVGLVSGHRDKALKVAAQHGVQERAIYDYADFDRIAENPEIRVVYIALPNSMHAEFTERAARAGKHVLCEKPMATSVADAQHMIEACSARAGETDDRLPQPVRADGPRHREDGAQGRCSAAPAPVRLEQFPGRGRPDASGASNKAMAGAAPWSTSGSTA